MQITLAAARVNAGFTQAEASRRIGVTRKTLFSWEKGLTTPPMRYKQAIEGLYGVDIGDVNFCPKITRKA